MRYFLSPACRSVATRLAADSSRASVRGPCCSENSPGRLANPIICSSVSRASFSLDARVSASTSQNVHVLNVPNGALHSVGRHGRIVAINETAGHEPAFMSRPAHGVDSGKHARIVRRHDEHQRHHERRGIQRIAAETLDVGLALLAPAPLPQRSVSLIAHAGPFQPVSRK